VSRRFFAVTVVATSALALATAPAAYFLIGDQSSCCFAPGELNYWWRQPSWWQQSTIAALGWAGIAVTAISVGVLISIYVAGHLRRREAASIAALAAVGVVIAGTYREATSGGIGALIGIQATPILGAAVVVGLLATAWRLVHGQLKSARRTASIPERVGPFGTAPLLRRKPGEQKK
jgi:hypothetical protein